MRRFLSHQPLFILLLPCFFVFHGYVEFFDLIPVKTAIVLFIQYSIGALILLLICRLLFKSWARAGIFCFTILCLFFFFGSLQDLLQKRLPESFFTRYGFILPFFLVLYILLFILLKRLKKDPSSLLFFLNLILPVLILTDGLILLNKIRGDQDPMLASESPKLSMVALQDKPDIYFIITDGYSGNAALNEYFQFNNSEFENELMDRGFFVADSSFSNYNYTIFSVASTLNMAYLRNNADFNGKTDLPLAFKALRENRVMKFFEKEGYKIVNNSIFDLDHQPSPVVATLLHFEKSPLTTQTFLYRFNRDLGYHLTRLFGDRREEITNTLFTDLENNQRIDSMTRRVTMTADKDPRFVYTHLVMPHWPYYFDSVGRRIAAKQIGESSHADKALYVSYLKYVNKNLLSLVDHIRAYNKRPAVIVMMGDHGCRECLEETTGRKAQVINLNAVYLPDKNYTGFYKGMSSVNEFRIIFNTSFGQHLPMLKDSTVLIKIKE